MRRLLTSVGKDLLLLRRDLPALATLFIMPAVLMLVISLVHDGAMRTMQGAGMKVLLLDSESGGLAEKLAGSLEDTGFFQVLRQVEGTTPGPGKAADLVAEGKIRIAVQVQSGTLKAIEDRVSRRMEGEAPGDGEDVTPPVKVMFHSDLHGVSRQAMLGVIRSSLARIEMEVLLEAFGRMRGESPGKADLLPQEAPLQVSYLPDGPPVKKPSSSEHNIPAWTVFAMFFIVVPLSSHIIHERQEGTLYRLRTMPVSYVTIMLGKVGAFLLVCMLQFILLLFLGTTLLPLLGPDRPSFVFDPAALSLVSLCVSLAACGFGILLGTLASSHEQASVTGAVTVIIAAAMGGIMVPVYTMPHALRKLSALSPLHWGHEAFLSVLLRDGSPAGGAAVVKLTAFFAATVLLTMIVNFTRRP